MVEPVHAALNLNASDKILHVKENCLADAHFVLAAVIEKCLTNNQNVCLVITHTTIGHFHTVGKRLGYDLLSQIENGSVRVIEPLKGIATEPDEYLSDDKKGIVKKLFMKIKLAVDELSQNNQQTNLVIDDISHLLDLKIGIDDVITFVKYCCGLSANDHVYCTIKSHVSCEDDEIISNYLSHCCDLVVAVSALKTGTSKNVSGIMETFRPNAHERKSNKGVYHYKLMDKEVRILQPGRVII